MALMTFQQFMSRAIFKA